MDDREDEKTLKDRLMTWLFIFNILQYSYLLIFDAYIVVKYIIKEKKHDITYLISFYSLTFALALSKICMCIFLLRYTGEHVYQDYAYDVLGEIGP